MKYSELKEAALPELAAIAADAGAAMTVRLAAFETLWARVSDFPDSWSSFNPTERAALRAAFALGSDFTARNGYLTAADVRRADFNRKHFGTIAERAARAETVAALSGQGEIIGRYVNGPRHGETVRRA